MFRLMAFVLAVSGLSLGSSARADEAEDKAVALVEKFGGKVTRDDKAPGKPVVGVSLFTGPGKVNLKVTDAGLKELAALKNLTTLMLGGAKVTDAGLKELAALKSLTTLNLNGTAVTDAGLKELAALKGLTTLGLFNMYVTAAGLKELAELKNLSTLDLSDKQVTDAGLKELQKALPKCKIITK